MMLHIDVSVMLHWDHTYYVRVIIIMSLSQSSLLATLSNDE